ncbi:hypothetical protein PPSIR1_15800 [Plesiocystis pacifica SIR-1]|uniref:ATP-grasp domain-containing protein n=1 Tax=Plesiocystis pacifica SIR-1 TaxID=391625 RepID=A6GEN6_9BACT|nr:hypothetical protein [Plesiocystis pacifica]EDM75682.1 hypothetical protein PPSIR1_15800 [Plesiocystis pacifica SIR-1]
MADSAGRPWSRTNQLTLAAAERLGVEVRGLGSEHSDFFMVLRAPGRPEVLISKTRSPFLTQVAQTLSNNKFLSRERLASRGVPVVPQRLFDEGWDPRSVDGARAAAKEWLEAHGELVLKPNGGNRGVGVVSGVRDRSGFEAAYAFARALDRDEEVVAEPYLPGVNVRVAVVGGRALAAAIVQRPALIGDGARDCAALLAELDADPRRATWERRELLPLDRFDPEMVAERLAASGRVAEDVLAPGERVELSFEEAEVVDCTDTLHPGWRRCAEQAAAALGVDVGGVDLRGLPEALFEAGPVPGAHAACVLEVNVLPALHLHALPTRGQPRPVFEAFVRYCVQLPGAPAPCASIEL